MPNMTMSFFVGHARAIVRRYIFDTTLSVFRQALAEDSSAAATGVLIASSTRDSETIWTDTLIAAAAILVVLIVSTCFARMLCKTCSGLSVSVGQPEPIAGGEPVNQFEARQKRKAKKRPQGAGCEEKPTSLAEETRGAVLPTRQVAISAEVGTTAEVYAASEIRRASINSAPASVMRGFPEVDILVASPSQRYVLVSCRSKRRTILFPQGSDGTYMVRGKELGAAATAGSLPSVEAALSVSMSEGPPPEVYAAAFSTDDSRLLVGERGTDQIFALTVSGASGHLSPLWACPLPEKRLVSSLPARWHAVGVDGIIGLTDRDCGVEMISLTASGSATSFKDRFKVGTATAWAQLNEQIGVAGSFLREPRLARLSTRTNGTKVLEQAVLFPNPLKMRVTAMALVAKGVPAFNTRSYFIVFFESGECCVYDLDSLAQSNTPAVCASFKDTDYAGHDPKVPLRLFTCMAGKAYQEELLIGLYRSGAKLTVYRQAGHSTELAMSHVIDIFGPMEGGLIRDAIFLQNGKGIAVCGSDDGRHVRMFNVPL